jgi:multidrug efflux pump subunit AcrB
MIYLPTMLIFTLTASLIVAFIMNPVFAVDFMNHDEHGNKQKKSAIFRKPIFWIVIAAGILLDVFGFRFLGNLILFFMLLVLLHRYVLESAILSFQNRVLPALMNRYERSLRWALAGWRPAWLLLGTFGLLVFSIVAIGMATSSNRVPVVFFPQGDPNQVYVYLKLPTGTSVDYTDSVTRTIEQKVYKVLDMDGGRPNPVVESVISNVGVGASDPQSGDRSTRPELGRVQVSFVEFEKRHGKSTSVYLDNIRSAIKGIPGAELSVSQEQGGPPTEPPVNIEIVSEDFDALTRTAVSLKNYLDSIQVAGVEELRWTWIYRTPKLH